MWTHKIGHFLAIEFYTYVPTIIKYITHKLLVGWGPICLINFSINFDVDTTITIKDFL
jgi:hypothetical protein